MKICIAMKSYINGIDFRVKKWHCFDNPLPSHTERFVCCTLTIRYITYSTVGRSIASISNLGGIFSSALRASANMAPWSNISAIDLPTVLYIIHMVW